MNDLAEFLLDNIVYAACDNDAQTLACVTATSTRLRDAARRCQPVVLHATLNVNAHASADVWLANHGDGLTSLDLTKNGDSPLLLPPAVRVAKVAYELDRGGSCRTVQLSDAIEELELYGINFSGAAPALRRLTASHMEYSSFAPGLASLPALEHLLYTTDYYDSPYHATIRFRPQDLPALRHLEVATFSDVYFAWPMPLLETMIMTSAGGKLRFRSAFLQGSPNLRVIDTRDFTLAEFEGNAAEALGYSAVAEILGLQTEPRIPGVEQPPVLPRTCTVADLYDSVVGAHTFSRMPLLKTFIPPSLRSACGLGDYSLDWDALETLVVEVDLLSRLLPRFHQGSDRPPHLKLLLGAMRTELIEVSHVKRLRALGAVVASVTVLTTAAAFEKSYLTRHLQLFPSVEALVSAIKEACPAVETVEVISQESERSLHKYADVRSLYNSIKRR